MGLLDYYVRHEREVNVLANGDALFLLSFLDHAYPITLRDLVNEFGWEQQRLEAALELLKQSEFVETAGPHEGVAVLSEGRDLLRSAGLDAATVTAVDEENPVPSVAIPLVVVGAGVLLIRRALQGDRFASLLLGAAAGAAAAVLLAPRSGEETRTRIKETVLDARDAVQERGAGVKDEIEEIRDKGRERGRRKEEGAESVIRDMPVAEESSGW